MEAPGWLSSGDAFLPSREGPKCGPGASMHGRARGLGARGSGLAQGLWQGEGMRAKRQGCPLARERALGHRVYFPWM